MSGILPLISIHFLFLVFFSSSFGSTKQKLFQLAVFEQPWVSLRGGLDTPTYFNDSFQVMYVNM